MTPHAHNINSKHPDAQQNEPGSGVDILLSEYTSKAKFERQKCDWNVERVLENIAAKRFDWAVEREMAILATYETVMVNLYQKHGCSRICFVSLQKNLVIVKTHIKSN